jgi:hypothetical protein
METSSYYYNMVAGLATVVARTTRGACGNLILAGNWNGYNWFEKGDKPGMPCDFMGRPMVYWEWKVLCNLQGLGIVPTVDTETSPLEGGVFYIECINNAATLGDYVVAYLDGLLPFEMIKEILLLAKEVVDKFHACGYCHNDLHSNNLVVGHDRKGWRVYVIDVALATLNGRIPDWLDSNFCISDDPEQDILYLIEDIGYLCEGCPDPSKVEELTLFVNRVF